MSGHMSGLNSVQNIAFFANCTQLTKHDIRTFCVRMTNHLKLLDK